MAKNDELFVLIHSLTRNEKRYFKVQCGNATNYLQLFDAIDKQEKYNEVAIKQKFKNETFVKQLHVTKNYLRSLILKCLRDFHAMDSKNAELKDILRNIEILYNKELYELCLSELKRAKKMATDFELNVGLLEVYEWKRRLEQQARPNNYPVFAEILTEQESVINSIHTTNGYWQLTNELTQRLTAEQKVSSKFLHMLDDEKNAITLEEKVLHYNSIYFRHIFKGDSEKAAQALYTLVEILESDPKKLRHNMSLYSSSVNNLISYLVFTKKYDDALQLINRAKIIYQQWRLAGEHKTILKQVLRTYNIELEIYRDNKIFISNPTYIGGIDEFISANENKMPDDYRLSVYFQLASIHFSLKNYSRALHWVNRVLNHKFTNQRTDIQVQIRLLNLMVHLEQQNMFVLRHFVDSTRRFINKVGNITEGQQVLLRFFIKIGQAFPYQYKDLFIELHEQLFPPNAPSLLAPSALDFIDYKTWIEEKTGNMK